MAPESTAPLPADSLTREEEASFDPARMSYLLEVLSGAEHGQSVALQKTLIIGSIADCDLVLTDSTVSRRHVKLERSPQGIWVKDLGSKNGLFLNGVRVEGFLVRRESTFTAGTTVLRLSGRPDDVRASRTSFGEALGQSAPMQELFHTLERVAAGSSGVLLWGETGTGKEVLAHAVHDASPRRLRPYRIVDCGGLAPQLVESELFGHVRGAFTGADADRLGAFSSANLGTVFLDEVGELPLELQPKLLRVLENRKVRRLGDDAERPVDVRVIAATHRDLREEVRGGRFREDLYFRLAVVVARVPPLRERMDDLPLLVQSILSRLKRPELELSPELLKQLHAHQWPGNVRELRNVIERAVSGAKLELPTAPAPSRDTSLPYKEAKEQLVEVFTREYFTRLFEKSGRSVTELAKAAGIARTYAHEVVKKYGLK